ncbi:Uncharacterised protein [Candidatus Gugararchaeum adminiculabundum]|nr:Uncharacterised protein [Candidatus Gugararchaeum adminiculabundum]
MKKKNEKGLLESRGLSESVAARHAKVIEQNLFGKRITAASIEEMMETQKEVEGEDTERVFCAEGVSLQEKNKEAFGKRWKLKSKE